MYNNACTVVIALQTAFPCPLPVAGRTTADLYAAFISEFRTSMMYRPNVYGDDHNETNLRAPPRQWAIHVYYAFSTLKRISRTLSLERACARSRKSFRGEYDSNVSAYNAHILCTYVNNVIYCTTRVRRLMWT